MHVTVTIFEEVSFNLLLQIELIRPQPGTVEMDQDLLWKQVQETISDAIKGNGSFTLAIFSSERCFRFTSDIS